MATPKRQNVSLSVSEKIKILDRIKSRKQRHRILAEIGMAKQTLENLIANEAKLRESASELDTSRKRPDRERMTT